MIRVLIHLIGLGLLAAAAAFGLIGGLLFAVAGCLNSAMD